MFTGIITDVGVVHAIEQRDGWLHLQITASVTAARVQLGSSVAVNGVCLTVNAVDTNNGTMDFSILPATLAVTRVGSFCAGERVNLECSLRVGDELGGHFVYGHVDGMGTVTAVAPDGESVRMTVRLTPELLRFTAPKGAIALDGVSLTIADMDATSITVALVEYTLDHTNLRQKKIGDCVHVECDMVLKYLSRST